MSKGFSDEREVATDLSLWWTEYERDDVIWRTSGSGARATTRQKAGKTTAAGHGDLTFTDPIAKPLFDVLYIENKRGYSNTSMRLKPKNVKDTIKKMHGPMPKTKKKRTREQYQKELISKLFSKTKKGGRGVDVLNHVDSMNEEGRLIEEWWEDAEYKRSQTDILFSMIILRRDFRQRVAIFSLELYNNIRIRRGMDIPANKIILFTGTHKLVIVAFNQFLGWCTPEIIKSFLWEESKW